MRLDPLKALSLLAECTGDDIWSREHCRQRGIPESWLNELLDCFESGFEDDSQTIYLGSNPIHQYEGIRDVDLAIKLGAFLGADIDVAKSHSFTRRDLVKAIQQQVEEG